MCKPLIVLWFCSQSYSDSFPSLFFSFALFVPLTISNQPLLYLVPFLSHSLCDPPRGNHRCGGSWVVTVTVLSDLCPSSSISSALPSVSLLMPLPFCPHHSCCHLLIIFSFTFCVFVFMLPLRLLALIRYSNEWVWTHSEYCILCRPPEHYHTKIHETLHIPLNMCMEERMEVRLPLSPPG